METFELEAPVEIKSRWTRTLVVLKDSVKNRQTTLNVVLASLCILLVAVVTIQMIVILYEYEEPSAVPSKCTKNPNPKNPKILNSREYQIELAGIKSWGPRNTELGLWIDAINSLSSLDLKIEDIENLYHDEHNVSPKKCHSKDSFRIRTYFNSSVWYNTTIDIKANGSPDTDNTICSSPFWPAPQYFANQTAQKCEHDYHYSYTKFSRETRITMVEPTTFSHCGDLVENFPWAFDSLKTYELLNDLTPLPMEYWWLGKNVGYLDGDTKYQIEFTLQYSDLETAFEGHKPPQFGEFSIRVYTMGNGETNDWNQKAIDEAETLWYGLMDIFGNKEMKQFDGSDEMSV